MSSSSAKFSVSDSDSSSSSDESDSESEEEVVKNQSSESITVEKKIVVFDENVKPEDCEQQLFELTFELRSKRHGIEQDIQQTKNKLDQSYKKLTIANAEKDFTKIKLEQTMVELETFQVRVVRNTMLLRVIYVTYQLLLLRVSKINFTMIN